MSLLNLDAHGADLKNEKKIEEIEEISTNSRSCELKIQFKKAPDSFWISKITHI